jgi:hypothetical protein
VTELATVVDLEPTDPSPLFAPDAERAVVGELLFNPASAKAAAALVTPGDFADGRLGQVFALVLGMLGAAEDPTTVDFHAVRAEIKVRRAADEMGLGDRDDRRRGHVLLPATTLPKTYRWLADSDLATLVTRGRGTIEGPARQVLDAAMRRAAVREAQQTIAEAHSVSDATLVAPNAAARFQDLRDAHTPAGRLRAKTLREVMEADEPGYDWVVPGLLERGDRLVVTGEEGLGKSTFLRQLVVAAAAGVHPLRLSPIDPVSVVVVDAENSERQWRRKSGPIITQAARFGTVHPLDSVRLACVGRMDLTAPADLAAVHRLLDDHQPDILVIGPLYKLIPRAINSDDDAAPLIAALDSLRDRGPCLLMEAHAGHATTGVGGSRDLRPRGSAALLGWPEFGFGLGRNRENPEAIADLRRWRGDRDERDWPAQLIRGGTFPWSDEQAHNAARHAHSAWADRAHPDR